MHSFSTASGAGRGGGGVLPRSSGAGDCGVQIVWCARCSGSAAASCVCSSPSAASLKLSRAGRDGVPGSRATPVAPAARTPAALSPQVRVGQGWEGGGCKRAGQGLGLEGSRLANALGFWSCLSLLLQERFTGSLPSTSLRNSIRKSCCGPGVSNP